MVDRSGTTDEGQRRDFVDKCKSRCLWGRREVTCVKGSEVQRRPISRHDCHKSRLSPDEIDKVGVVLRLCDQKRKRVD